jgi:uncharacterized hydrophobic protein (TIGR00271 family)
MAIINRTAFELKPEERQATIKRLIEQSYPGSHFFILLIASAVIATVGLSLDSEAIIIGSMLVAPFLWPVLSLSLGISLSDFSVIKRSLLIVERAAIVTIVTSAIVALFVSEPTGFGTQILARASSTLPYLYVAIAAGVAASFSTAKPNLYEFLVGVAVSVSVLPPLANFGIGLRHFDADIMLGSLQLFGVNLVGIIFGGMVIFSLMGFYPARKQAATEIRREEKKIEKENAAVEAVSKGTAASAKSKKKA